MSRLANVTINLFRHFLIHKGLEHVRTNHGHEDWSMPHLKRPVVFQTHIDPIPEDILIKNLHLIGSSRDEFIQFLER